MNHHIDGQCSRGRVCGYIVPPHSKLSLSLITVTSTSHVPRTLAQQPLGGPGSELSHVWIFLFLSRCFGSSRSGRFCCWDVRKANRGPKLQKHCPDLRSRNFCRKEGGGPFPLGPYPPLPITVAVIKIHCHFKSIFKALFKEHDTEFVVHLLGA